MEWFHYQKFRDGKTVIFKAILRIDPLSLHFISIQNIQFTDIFNLNVHNKLSVNSMFIFPLSPVSAITCVVVVA
jgi:hypothetical protein